MDDQIKCNDCVCATHVRSNKYSCGASVSTPMGSDDLHEYVSGPDCPFTTMGRKLQKLESLPVLMAEWVISDEESYLMRVDAKIGPNPVYPNTLQINIPEKYVIVRSHRGNPTRFFTMTEREYAETRIVTNHSCEFFGDVDAG